LNVALLLLPAAIWASLVVVGANVMEDIGPISLACTTWGIAALVLLITQRRSLRGTWHIVRQEFGLLVFCGLSGIAAFQALWFCGLVRTTSTNVAVLMATLPVMITALAAVVLGERLRRLQIIGVMLTIIGALWVGVSGDLGRLLKLHLGSGEILILMANLSMSGYTVALKRSPSSLAPLSFMALIAPIGTLALLPLMYVEGGFVTGWQPYLRHLGAIAYIGVIAGGAAYALWNESVIRNGANLTGLSLYAQPGFAIVFSWFFLGQSMLAYHWQGAAFLITGIGLVIGSEGFRSPGKEPT